MLRLGLVPREPDPPVSLQFLRVGGRGRVLARAVAGRVGDGGAGGAGQEENVKRLSLERIAPERVAEQWYDEVKAVVAAAREALSIADVEVLAEHRTKVNQAKVRTEAAIAAIRSQLADRTAPVEHGWKVQANRALRHSGALVQDVQICQGELRDRIAELNRGRRREWQFSDDPADVDLANVRKLWVLLGIALGELDPEDV